MHRKIDVLARRRVLVGALAWIGFGLCWWLVLRRDPRTWRDELLVPLVSLAAVTAVTLLWVHHNLSIYRRKGPRRGLPDAGGEWRTDGLGRPLLLPIEARYARVVEVDVQSGVKQYTVRR